MPTRLLVNGSHFLLYAGPFLAIGITLAIIFVLRWRQSAEGRQQTDAWLLRIPVVRDFVVQAAILNFAHTLAVLIENGVTTAEALRLTERAVDNTKVQEILHEATDRVIEGASLCASLQRTALMPPLFLDPPRRGRANRQPRPESPADRAFLPGGSVPPAADGHAADVRHRSFPDVRLRGLLAYAIVTALFQVSASFRL
ncbi:MAG: type II secretion system F family protein [Lacunisphaera sp.]